MTDVASTAAPPLFTVPSDRPLLDREVLTVLHESTQPLDIDAIHEDLNAERSRPHVARGPLETLLAELVKAGKAVEVAHGQPARPHFVLVDEVRQQLDGSWQRARVLAAIVTVLGDPQNRCRIQDVSNTLGAACAKSEDALPIPTHFLNAVIQSTDMNSPEAVDAFVATQLDALVRNGQVAMLADEPPPDATPVDAPSEASATDDAPAAEEPSAAESTSDAEPEMPAGPNLHTFTFALFPSAWQRMVTDGALAVAIEAVPELVQQRQNEQGAVREARAEIEKLAREFDVFKGVTEQRHQQLLTENKQLRAEQARFMAFCEEKGIDFALATSGHTNERLHETHTIRGKLTIDTYLGIIAEHEKAQRYASILEERVKNAATSGKNEVKEAKARADALESLVHSGRSNIDGDYQREKGCIKYIQSGCVVWESDEPHDKGKIVDIQPINAAADGEKEKKDGEGESKNEKPKAVQLAIPGTTRKGELEWRPGDAVPGPVPVDHQAANESKPSDETISDDSAPPPESSDEPEEHDDDSAQPDDGEQDDDEGDDEGDDNDGTAPENAAPSAPQSNVSATTGIPAIDQASTKTFIRNYLSTKGRSTVDAVSAEFAQSVGAADKPRVVKYGSDIIRQLAGTGELESEIVGNSEFIWLKAQTPATADADVGGKQGRGKGRGRSKSKSEE